MRIPVIVSKDGGGFYVSDSITATRINKKDGSYIAISDHILNYNGFKQFTTGVNYGLLNKHILHIPNMFIQIILSSFQLYQNKNIRGK